METIRNAQLSALGVNQVSVIFIAYTLDSHADKTRKINQSKLGENKHKADESQQYDKVQQIVGLRVN